MESANAGFAEVVVGVGDVRGPQTFHYEIPPDLRDQIRPGQLVLVPFGARQAHAVVLALANRSPVEETRQILDVIWKPCLIDALHLELARWVSARYGAPILDALELVAPPGLARYLDSSYLPVGSGDERMADLTAGERTALTFVRAQGEASERDILRAAGKTATRRGMQRLVRAGLVNRRLTLRFPEPAAERLAVGVAPDSDEAVESRLARAPKQRELWDVLMDAGGPLPVAELLGRATASEASLRGLVANGLARIDRRWTRPYVVHAPLDQASDGEEVDESAWNAIRASLDSDETPAVLLQGDERDRRALYLRAVNHVVAAGYQALVIAPDARTASALAEWLAAHATATVADAGRARTDAERVAFWQSARAAELDVVVGARAATFAPLSRLGVVIVDREEDPNHKHRSSPRFHVRPSAEQLARLSRCALVLGAETPSVAGFYRVEQEQYRFVLARSAELLRQTDRRVGRGWGMQRPSGYVDVIDLRETSTAGRYRVITRPLLQALRETLNDRGRAVLYVNRRGRAALTVCRDCGHVFQCERCSAGLVHHAEASALRCHMCNWRVRIPDECPSCGGRRLRLWGYGSEAVAEAVARLLPKARVARIDSDRPAREVQVAINAFARAAGVDVLVGTQRLLAFGDQLRAPLLGIVQADIGLQFPDFLAPERVFLSLMRLRRLVTGGDSEGRTQVQTLMPGHHVIEAFRVGSYLHFFRAEIGHRTDEGLPPIRPLARVSFGHRSDQQAEDEARRARRELETVIGASGPLDAEILGPAPNPIHRQRGQYRWQMLLFGTDVHRLLPLFHRGWKIDVDPIDLT